MPPAEAHPAREATTAAATPRQWRTWLAALLSAGRQRLAGASLLLLAVFAVGAAALWVFGEVVDEVFEGETAALDSGVLAALRQFQSPAADRAAFVASLMGSEVVAVLLVVLLAGFAWTGRWGAAASLVLVTVGAALLNSVLKDHFQRTRPGPVTSIIAAQQWSFPSGHAMVAAAFYVLLAYLGASLLPRWLRRAWPVTMLLLVLAIGVSRLYLGVHYLTDVVAGYAAGTAWALAVIGAGHLLSLRRGAAGGGPGPPGDERGGAG